MLLVSGSFFKVKFNLKKEEDFVNHRLRVLLSLFFAMIFVMILDVEN